MMLPSNSQRDVYLVLDNAMQYNKSETTFHRVASRIKKNATPLLDVLDSIPATGQLMPPLPEGKDAWRQPPEGEVGDLETSLARLQSMLAPDPTEEGRDMLRSIFTFEVGKEPPPPPSPKKRKTLSAAERNKKFEAAAERYKERLSLGGGSARVSRAAAAVTGPESPPPLPTPGQRKGKVASADAEGSEPSKPARPQPGVVGVESVPALSDKERRKAEKSLDLIAESLDSKDEYERFNVGWILPEGSKRRRPVPTPTIAIPPKRATSRASSASVASEARSKRRRTTTPGEAPAPKKRQAKAEAKPEPQQTEQPVAEEPELDAEGEDEELTPVPDSAVTPTFPRSSLSPPPADGVDDAASDKTAVEPTPAAGKADKVATPDRPDEPMAVDPVDEKVVDGTKDLNAAPGAGAEGEGADTAEPEPEPEPELEPEPETPVKDRKKGAVPPKRSPPPDGSDAYPPGTQGKSPPYTPPALVLGLIADSSLG